MPIAITDDHRELGTVARSFLEGSDAVRAARTTLDATTEELPGLWKELADLGWLGLHIPEQYGGSGYGLPELVVVVEELGRVVAPGPFLPSAWAAGVVNHAGSDKLKKALLPGLVDGALIGAVGFGDQLKEGANGLSGKVMVLGAGLADVVLLTVGKDVVVVDADQKGVKIETAANLDPTRRIATVTLKNVRIGAGRTLRKAAARATALGRTLAAAEASGGAGACVQMASEYVKVRKQFGRVIATFQAVKHHAANMLVASELATAGAWDAARAERHEDQFELAAAVAAAQAVPSFVQCAQLNIQLHGGIGFTWEHDAHLYLRRAGALAAVFGPIPALQQDVTRMVLAGVTREHGVDLPPEAAQIRTEVRAFIKGLKKLDDKARLAALLDEGYVNPHWPKPWGRAAGAVEQLVIDEEFEGVPRPQYGIGGWIIQTLTQHASDDQIQRWIRPSLEGEYRWCQLFSEPDAGSDAAGIRTRGTRVDGGWLVTGQKIWTSGAHHCNRGFATVRTDPDAPKHKGISMMVIDLDDAAVEVRPLREASGGSMFCEVFFNDYFVADDDVVGEVNSGWRVARSTLGNERVSIGRGSVGSNAGGNLIGLAKAHKGDTGAAAAVGALLAEEQAMGLLNLRTAERAIVGGEPGPEGNVAKLLNGEHAQRVTDLGLALGGPAAGLLEGDDEGGFGRTGVASNLIFTRCLTIAGGTSEIVRNQIGERILGLPRDPLID